MVPLFEKYGINNSEIIKTDARLGDVMRNFSDTSKAKEQLGWTTKTSLESGIEQTIQFFVNK